MSNSTSWMPLYWGDYLADTQHLSTLEHGAYLLLIGRYWTGGKPLPADDARLAQIARLPLPQWRRVKPALADMFICDADVWRHKRIDKELQKAEVRYRQRVAASRKGVAARRKPNGVSPGQPDGYPDDEPNGYLTDYPDGNLDGYPDD